MAVKGAQVLFSMPTLDRKELEVVEKIDAVKATLGYALQAPKRWTGFLRRSTLGRAIQGSNSIEGYNVTNEDAMAAAQGAEMMDASEESRNAVTGYREAMTYVMQLADDPHFAYSAWLIRGLHYMMLQHDLTKNPGRWRPGPVFVYDEERKQQVYEGPEASLVPGLVEELVAGLGDADERIPCVVRAAMAHLNLVMIHPFADGNGRMARCLQTLVLAQCGTLAPPFSSIEEHLGKNQRDYYDVLAEVGRGSWHPESDARPWVRFCLKSHFIQASIVLRRTREIARLWEALEKEISERGLPERTINALGEAAVGLKVRNATYRLSAEVSNDVASRELKTLADAGLLVAHGERRGRYYEAAQQILEIRRRTREERTIADPFEELLQLP